MSSHSTSSIQDRQAARQHFAWMEKIAAAAGLSPMLRLLAIRLAIFRNSKTKKCFVGYETLAGAVCITKRSAMRCIAELERLGWIAVKRGGGRGWANEFSFLTPAETVTRESPFRGATSDGANSETVTPDAQKGDSPRQKTVTGESPLYKDNIGAAPQPPILGERVVAQGRNPGLGDAGAVARAPEKDSSNRENDYRALRDLWDRGRPESQEYEEAAQRAYAAARQKHDPRDIAKGAGAWVAAADEPRYLPRLAVFLHGCWFLKPPPRKRTRSQAHLGMRRKGKPSLVRAMLAHGGRR